MPETIAATISATNAFSASSPVDTAIPRSGLIPDIGMVLEARYDNSGGPTLYSDVFDRIINSITLAGDGRTFCQIGDMRLLAAMNAYDYGSKYKRSDPIVTTTNNLRNDIPYRLHFGNNPDDPFDPLGSDQSDPAKSPIVGIPANQMNTLVLTVNWGATTAMAASTGVVDTATALRVMPRVISPSYGQGRERFYPKWSTTTETFTATWTGLSKVFNVPVGVIVRRVFVMAVDNTAPSIRDDVRPTRIGLIALEGNSHRWEGTWDEFKQYSADQYPHPGSMDYSLVSINQLTGLLGTGALTNIASSQANGIGVFDFRKFAMQRDGTRINPLGADMRGLPEGTLKLAVDWGTANGQLLLLWDCLESFT